MSFKKYGDGVEGVSTTAVVIIVLTRLCKNIFSHPCRRIAWVDCYVGPEWSQVAFLWTKLSMPGVLVPVILSPRS